VEKERVAPSGEHTVQMTGEGHTAAEETRLQLGEVSGLMVEEAKGKRGAARAHRYAIGEVASECRERQQGRASATHVGHWQR
jgi:hypothetical protein